MLFTIKIKTKNLKGRFLADGKTDFLEKSFFHHVLQKHKKISELPLLVEWYLIPAVESTKAERNDS